MNGTEDREAKNGVTDPLGDLAFMRAIVSEGPHWQAASGQLYMVAGIAYGLQCLIQWVPLAGLAQYPVWLHLAASIVPTLVFLAVMTHVLWRDRKIKHQGVATRALNAIFSSTGLANLFMVAVFAYNAITQKSITIWLYYPIVVCAFQGAAWYAVYMIRKKGWMAAISAGWFLTTLLLGIFIYTPANYVLVLAFALTALMGGGGYIMLRQAKVG
jgi:hypothetical protein